METQYWILYRLFCTFIAFCSIYSKYDASNIDNTVNHKMFCPPFCISLKYVKSKITHICNEIYLKKIICRNQIRPPTRKMTQTNVQAPERKEYKASPRTSARKRNNAFSRESITNPRTRSSNASYKAPRVAAWFFGPSKYLRIVRRDDTKRTRARATTAKSSIHHSARIYIFPSPFFSPRTLKMARKQKLPVALNFPRDESNSRCFPCRRFVEFPNVSV